MTKPRKEITNFITNIKNLIENGKLNSTSPPFCKPNNTLDAKSKNTNYLSYYTNIIRKCDILIDDDCGIQNYLYPNSLGDIGSDNKSNVRIRDARNANKKKGEESSAAWTQALASEARGISLLLETIDVDEQTKINIEQAIAEKFYEAFTALKKASNEQEFKHITSRYSYEFIHILKNSNITLPDNNNLSAMDAINIAKMMNIVRDFGNFEDRHDHILTFTPQAKNNAMAWLSIKINPISQDIRQEYQNIDIPNKAPLWFKKLSLLEQVLVRKYRDRILSGTYVIPTQLRFLPGLKNCYQDTKIYNNQEYIEMHSGTMAYNAGNEVSNEAIRLTKLNIAHAKNLAGQNHLNLQVLNSNSMFEKPDQNICTIMAKSVDQKEIGYHQNGINLLASVFTKSGKGVIGTVTEISNRANELSQKENETLWTMCKSGKDRTFAMLVHNAAVIFGRKDNIYHKEHAQQIAIAMAHSNHADIMAAGGGGTRGAVGLKLGAALTGIKFLGTKWNARLSKDEILGGEVKKHWTNNISAINNWEKSVPKHQAKAIKKEENRQPIHYPSNTTSTPYLQQPEIQTQENNKENKPFKLYFTIGMMIAGTIFLGVMMGPAGFIIGMILSYSCSKLIETNNNKHKQYNSSNHNAQSTLGQQRNNQIDNNLKNQAEMLRQNAVKPAKNDHIKTKFAKPQTKNLPPLH